MRRVGQTERVYDTAEYPQRVRKLVRHSVFLSPRADRQKQQVSKLLASPTPPRLFIIFARNAPEAVIFRRGPARWYHVIRWNTRGDIFDRGAWFKGRIYPEKCDLSPDGQLLLYFAHQGSRLRTSYTDAWTAISRNPWLDAIGLWPQGTTYGGGGRFTDDRSAIIRGHASAHPDHPGAGISITSGDVPCHVSSEDVEGAEWSGRDQNGRLVFTLNGRLMHRNKAGEDICLADFNGYKPDPLPAPPSAGRPFSSAKPGLRSVD